MMESAAPLEQELRRVLKEKGSEPAEIEDAVKEFYSMIRYGTQPAIALKNAYTKYGVSGVSPQKRTIAEIRGEERSIEVVGRIYRIFEKTIERDGEPHTIFAGTLGDGTGSIRFTVWEPERFPEGTGTGDIIRIVNGYVRTWRDRPDIHVGKYAHVHRADESDLPEPSSADGVTMRISEMLEKGTTSVLVARVLSVGSSEVVKKGGNGLPEGEKVRILSGILADPTGKIRFTYWRPAVDIEQGSVIRVSGGYITSWRGIPRLTLDERDRIEAVDEPGFPGVEDLSASRTVTLERVFSEGGGLDVLIRGFVVDIRENSGYILRCPTCSRLVQMGTCRIHGKVEARPDLRVKGVIDDATDTCMFILGRDLTSSLLGMDIEECRAEIARMNDPLCIVSLLEERLLGRPFDISGNITRDDFGYMLIASDIQPVSLDAAVEAERIIEAWRSGGEGSV